MIDKRIIILHSHDNVAIALTDLSDGDTLHIDGRDLVLRSTIHFGHKLALKPIAAGTEILKYGLPIGISRCDINEGEHVHSHNLKSNYKAEQEK